jgi:hypothetical protein
MMHIYLLLRPVVVSVSAGEVVELECVECRLPIAAKKGGRSSNGGRKMDRKINNRPIYSSSSADK